MDMALKAKTDVEVALSVLRDMLQRMEKHHVATKEHVELYLKPVKEQITHVTKPLFNKNQGAQGTCLKVKISASTKG